MPMQLTYGLQYGIMILLQVCEPFFASVSIIRLIKSLLVDLSKVWQNTSCPYLIFTVCGLVKVHSTVFDHSNFLYFFHMQNVHTKYAKISTIQNFPIVHRHILKIECHLLFTRPNDLEGRLTNHSKKWGRYRWL